MKSRNNRVGIIHGMLFWMLCTAFTAKAEVVVHRDDLKVFKEIIHDAGKTLDEFIFINEFKIDEIYVGRAIIDFGRRRGTKGVTDLGNLVLVDENGRILAFDLEGSQLKTTSKLNQLKHLWAFGAYGATIEELDLHDLSHLQYLDVKGGHVKKIKILHNLPSLTYLNLMSDRIPDLDGVGGLPNVRYLELSGNELKNFEQLKKFKNVRTLLLMGAGPNIRSLEGLQYLKKMEKLRIAGDTFSDLTPLSGLQQLRILSLTFCNINSVQALEGLLSLEHLRIYNCNLKKG
ncbi:leucine-rich repeat domain-containing protein [Alkalimarinus sediminis]|uniref:Leucine-rich repeat domain-containing protein n=2 Tax=Alkalimarinus sediminis TaxID=1632866 RepID=A0A9E8HIR8_9ALTE|nr:hypothetical protein [Alkalimarinus sediminis]UZW74957.1 hypothetical protein NNL22_18350 [Alkalimarinus sediminis]